MRLRPIGPGIGGLYYAPQLRDVQSMKRTTQAIRRLPPTESATINALAGPASTIWQAVIAAARRFGQRFVEVRTAQAEAYVARAREIYNADAQIARARAAGVRYY